MKNKKIKMKYLHIIIIILGSIFVSIPIFHENLWFDESYTVGIVSKSFSDIWTIGSNDVHPIIYYWFLHIFYLIFCSNIYIYRFLSMIPIVILSILGYTHIRKDFGEKTGIFFSFLVLFLPISSVYSGEIRMYTWAMLVVSIMSIYGYRIYQQVYSKKEEYKVRIRNWTIFTIFSLASCYIHYYGLAAASVINVILLIYLIVQSVKKYKQDKKSKIFTMDLKYFTISAIVQILLYLPWFDIAVLKQIQGLSNGFWIPKPSPEIFLQIFNFQFTGDLDNLYISKTVATVFGAIISCYTIYCIIRTLINKKKTEDTSSNKAGIWAIAIYFIVMLCILIISIKKPILYARYFLNLTGLFIFFLAFFMAKSGRKVLTYIVSILIVSVSIVINYKVISMNYDASNSKPLSYIKQDIQQEDMILFDNRGSGFVISMQLIDNKNCFYDKEQWNVDEAYKAFGNDMLIIHTLEELEEYKGRIWLVSSDDYSIYNEFVEIFGQEKIYLIKKDEFEIKYHNYRYTITLIEKTI